MFKDDGKKRGPFLTLALHEELLHTLLTLEGHYLPCTSTLLQDEVPHILHIHRLFSSYTSYLSLHKYLRKDVTDLTKRIVAMHWQHLLVRIFLTPGLRIYIVTDFLYNHRVD